MFQTISEQDWVAEYIKKKKNPLPVVLGTKGTWTANKKPMIILIGFTLLDLFSLADIYQVSHHPVRKMVDPRVTYFAINIIDKKQVKKIIEDWKEVI